jgi:phage terminase Nu1 subunit (DNA packaging protein)
MSLASDMKWSRAELAEIFGVTPQRVGQFVQEGILPKPIGNRHDPKKAVAAFIRHLRQTKKSPGLQEEELEKLRLDNRLKRMRLARMSGELMSRDAVKHAWFASGRQIRATLENLPDRLAGPLAAETDQTAVFALLNAELHQLLDTLSRTPHVKQQKILAAV